MSTQAMDNNNPLMSYVIRMVVPLRREFGLQLDVTHFMQDFAYARAVLDEALQSRDPRLVEFARYVEQRLHGPRIANTQTRSLYPTQPTPAAQPTHNAQTASVIPEHEETPEEMRARLKQKYTSGNVR